VLESHRLLEIIELVRLFGVGPVIDMLEDGGVSIVCASRNIASVDQGGARSSIAPGDVWGFSLFLVSPAEHREYLHGCFGSFRQLDLRTKDLVKLKRAVLDRVLPPEPTAGQQALLNFDSEFESNAPTVRVAIGASVKRTWGVDMAPEVTFGAHRTTREFRIESNLANRYNVSADAARTVIRDGLLACGKLNMRLEDAARYQALPAFNDDDLSLFGTKLEVLLRPLLGGSPTDQLTRVAELRGLPDLDSAARAGDLDLRRVLAVRHHSDWHQARDWLRSGESKSDSEIAAEGRRLNERLAVAAQSTGAKVTRLLMTTGLGLIPVVGAVAGPIASALDMFIIERFLPNPGPLALLSRELRSLYDG
jgi:hypothetical protein